MQMDNQNVIHPYNEYYSEIKINELPSHEKAWRNFHCMLLRDRSQSEKATYGMVQLYDIWGKTKTVETVKR